MARFRVVFAVAVVWLCALFYACVVAHLQVPIHYANFQLEVDPRPVPVPAGAEEGQPQEQRQEQREEQRQEQRQEQQEGLEVDVDVVVDWDVPAVPEPADFGDALHSPDKFLKVPSAEATAVDVVDGGGTWRAPTSQLARANFPVGARQVRTWRANLRLGAPTCEFARAQAREANFGTFVPCRSVFSTRGA